jgi:hypothetical protein
VSKRRCWLASTRSTMRPVPPGLLRPAIVTTWWSHEEHRRPRVPRSRDPLAVSKHGHVIGFYIPVERDEGEARRAVARLGETVERVLKETGMNEEELAGLLDLRRALPK